ncbi:MAG: ATP-binding cassette domain-containing protein [Deltaproteobacteria bacterium]|nr:ATP-binding cassette domain-containing protein [Deltaproteobacteria bacterium]
MIRLEHISKVFNKGTADEKVAINDLSLHIESGEFVTVIGSNGAGKTTLLNLISGTYFPDAGTIVIDGTDVTRIPEHKRAKYIGRVFQDPLIGTAASMSIEENLAMAEKRGQKRGLKWGVTKAKRERYREVLKLLELGLEDRLKDPVGLLSGGQRQTLTLLMVTLSIPKVLLLDEHTAALDPKTAHRVLQLSKEMIENYSLTTIMVTHNMQQAIEFGNRMIMLHEGQIRFDVRGEKKRGLSVETLVKSFGSVLKDETLLTAAEVE